MVKRNEPAPRRVRSSAKAASNNTRMYVNAINRIYITLEYAQFKCYTPVTYTLRNTVKNLQRTTNLLSTQTK